MIILRYFIRKPSEKWDCTNSFEWPLVIPKSYCGGMAVFWPSSMGIHSFYLHTPRSLLIWHHLPGGTVGYYSLQYNRFGFFFRDKCHWFWDLSVWPRNKSRFTPLYCSYNVSLQKLGKQFSHNNNRRRGDKDRLLLLLPPPPAAATACCPPAVPHN